MDAARIFNPAPHVESVRLANGQTCIVVDDALLEPNRLLQFAAASREQLTSVDFSYYPGMYLRPPVQWANALGQFFKGHIRRCFDARRLVNMHCRLSMVTVSPQKLRPIQCICHRDRPILEAGHSIQACVLYLFQDVSLGGTSFYEPTRSTDDTNRLFQDATTMPRETFFDKYAIQPSYLGASNAWFTRVGGVPAKWNRIVFFDGFTLHSGDIPCPDRLTTDPLTGRLTLNGFFTSRRHLKWGTL